MITSEVRQVLYQINARQEVDGHLLTVAFEQVMNMKDQTSREIHLSAILVGIAVKGATKREIAALVNSVFRYAEFDLTRRLHLPLSVGEKLICAIGSGKKGFKTINITTPALIIAAAGGAYVVKPASRSTSSRTGSEDFLAKIGYKFPSSVDELCARIERNKFGAFSISDIIPRFDLIYGGRFYVPHALSLALPALVSPLICDELIFGVAHPDIQVSADVLIDYGIKDGLIMTTYLGQAQYIDELAPFGVVSAIRIEGGRSSVTAQAEFVYDSRFRTSVKADLMELASAGENIAAAIEVLEGRLLGVKRDAICLNAGLALMFSGKVGSLREGFEFACALIDSGDAKAKLYKIINTSGN